MPTYEYACRSCETHLEVVQRFDDDPLVECPSCGGRLRKVFGSIGISFKGSGFYKTDSRAVAKNGSGPSSKAPAGDGEKTATASGGDRGDDKATTGSEGASSAGKGKDGAAGAAKESKGSGSPPPATPSTTPAAKSA